MPLSTPTKHDGRAGLFTVAELLVIVNCASLKRLFIIIIIIIIAVVNFCPSLHNAHRSLALLPANARRSRAAASCRSRPFRRLVKY